MFFVDFPKGAKIILPKIYKYFTNFDKIRHINDLKQFQTDTLERQKEIFQKNHIPFVGLYYYRR